MTLDEAVKKFAKDFSSIPTELIKKAYKDDPENLICLNSEEYFEERPLEYFPAMWGCMFKCDDWTDEEWIKKNIDEVEKIGFIIYECEYCGILLGMNSCGHDFYEAYWQPLYLKRGLAWHEREKAAAKI
jgi:hypothetical protein